MEWFMSYVLESFEHSLSISILLLKAFNFSIESQTLTVKLAHLPEKYLFHPLKLSGFTEEKIRMKKKKKYKAMLFIMEQKMETEGNKNLWFLEGLKFVEKKIYRHMATLLLIYCKNTFIIAVESEGKVCVCV
jgi:hypothetical protein